MEFLLFNELFLTGFLMKEVLFTSLAIRFEFFDLLESRELVPLSNLYLVERAVEVFLENNFDDFFASFCLAKTLDVPSPATFLVFNLKDVGDLEFNLELTFVRL